MNDEPDESPAERPRPPPPAEDASAPGAGGNGAAARPATRSPRRPRTRTARASRPFEGAWNLKPSGRMPAPAASEAGVTPTPEAAVADPVFSCRDVNVYYGSKHALKNVSLDVGRSRCSP